MGMKTHASLLDKAEAASLTTFQRANIPVFGQFEFFLAMHKQVEDMGKCLRVSTHTTLDECV